VATKAPDSSKGGSKTEDKFSHHYTTSDPHDKGSSESSLESDSEKTHDLRHQGSSLVSEGISDDSHWAQNEQIFASFQENMALIAGNSFEILQLYEMISRDYRKINESVAEMEIHNKQVDRKSQALEAKLERIMRL